MGGKGNSDIYDERIHMNALYDMVKETTDLRIRILKDNKTRYT